MNCICKIQQDCLNNVKKSSEITILMASNGQGVHVARVENEIPAKLHNLNELVEAKERQIINKREYIQSLERRTVLGYALKVVEEMPNGS